MRYHYTYRTKAIDLWQLSMYYIYGSMAGMCNAIFTVAMLILTITKWSSTGSVYRFFMVLVCCLFPVIQPLFVYAKAKKQASGIKEDTEAGFADSGIYIRVGDKTSELSWDTIKRVAKKPTMIIVFSDTVHGFVLTNSVLGKDRESFYQYVVSKIK